ncbi:MAG: Fur family transcriptional regulator [Candidatus Cloacimonadota bacterium]|nr:Fur family transcriptional regulator [Candidatus Cloacimonadota bacterium]
MNVYVAKLDEKNVSVTAQRVKILEYLDKHRIHPTAKQVFLGIKDNMIKISKATVYNTLNLLAKKKIINELSIFEKTTRYDFETTKHSHFKCMKCGKIIDIYQSCNLFENNEFDDNKVIEQHLFLKGICKECMS